MDILTEEKLAQLARDWNDTVWTQKSPMRDKSRHSSFGRNNIQMNIGQMTPTTGL
jgi:hypothetical protein